MFKYFFILGSNPTLSMAELSAVFPHAPAFIANQDVLILDLAEKIDAKQLIARLGGTIKIGEIRGGERPFTPTADDEIKKQIFKLFDLNNIKGKFKFGISCYGSAKFNIKPLGMELKKYLRNKNITSRWVTCRGESRFAQSLSSVVVEQNKLVDQGLEIVLIKTDNKILIGKTLAVQPFKQLSFRDYGRPARDDYAGMLPPKLAQIMINLASPGSLASKLEAKLQILDPFCGSGTILTEAMLMGYTNLIGSDISTKAIEDTKNNIKWIKQNFQFSIFPPKADQPLADNFQLFNTSVEKLINFIKPQSVDAIITEPYLGPQRGKINFGQTINQLNDLYSQSLKIFKQILKPTGRIVMVWPVFNFGNQLINLTPALSGFKIINPLPDYLVKNAVIKLTKRNTIIYGRPGQKVWREIVVLTNF